MITQPATEPLIYHSVHRNPSAPEYWTDEMAVVDAAPHDFDIARWLLADELSSIQVFSGKQNAFAGRLRDPLVMVLRTRSGALVTVETSMNVGYAYDIRGEVVGERGTAALADPGRISTRSDNRAGTDLPVDWRERFIEAYDAELRAWIDALTAGAEPSGPSSWDGYAAQVASEAGVRSLKSGERIDISEIERPSLYETSLAMCGDRASERSSDRRVDPHPEAEQAEMRS
ncbi:Gfo/Idh/MocA family oxidoreductase [Actinophytocola sp.]|uniref:Gfo/Idh/MocA family oxidoreductase n=1 Tax=Actinophytocola sp. TaxID=1872138 RepID=UPI003899B48B